MTYKEFQDRWSHILRQVKTLAEEAESLTEADGWIIRADMHLQVGASPRVAAYPVDRIPRNCPPYVNDLLGSIGLQMTRWMQGGGEFPTGNLSIAPADIPDSTNHSSENPQ